MRSRTKVAVAVCMCGVAGWCAYFEMASHNRSRSEMVLVPVVLQAGPSDCGLAVLATMLTALGKPTTLADIGSGIDVPQKGLSMLALQRLAARHSLQLEGVRDREKRLNRWRFPWIAHMADGAWQHYVLVEHVTEVFVTVADPARGRVTLQNAAFIDRWSGRALVIASRPQSGVLR